jgi:hypothetical protein
MLLPPELTSTFTVAETQVTQFAWSLSSLRQFASGDFALRANEQASERIQNNLGFDFIR